MAAHDHTITLASYLTMGAATLTLDGTAFSIARSVDLPEDTVWGDTYKQRLIGVQDIQATFEALNDFTDNELDEDIDALMGTAFAVDFRPATGSPSATNPAAQFTGAISNLQKTYAHGQVAKISGTIMLTSGTLTRAVA